MTDDITPQRFADLPKETQEFLRDLRKEDIALLAQSIQLMRSILTVGSLVKWAVILIVGTFVGAVAFGDAILRLKNYFMTGTFK